MRQFADYGVEVLHAWGMTEVSPLRAHNQHLGWPQEERDALRAKQGRPVFGVEMKIVDDRGQDLPRDGQSCGNLMVRGPWIAARFRITRQLLEVLAACRHPVVITTKSALVLRDLDLLAPMAEQHLAAVQVSITTLDPDLGRRLEPRAASPKRRLEVIRNLAVAGVPVGVLVSPLIPGLTDSDLEPVLVAATDAGARRGGSLLIRLPLEIKDLFQGWLTAHYPDRANKVLSLIRQCRDGRLNDAQFGTRFTGTGPVAELLQRRFELAATRLGLRHADSGCRLDTRHFRPPLRRAARSLCSARDCGTSRSRAVPPRSIQAPPADVRRSDPLPAPADSGRLSANP